MAAVSLFRSSNMAAVMSCGNILLVEGCLRVHSLIICCVDVGCEWRYRKTGKETHNK